MERRTIALAGLKILLAALVHLGRTRTDDAIRSPSSGYTARRRSSPSRRTPPRKTLGSGRPIPTVSRLTLVMLLRPLTLIFSLIY